jgi:TfoX/Sxy family transcriptional regulator of competence genes
MAYDQGLAQRIRELLEDQAGVSERKMFGGLAFMRYGHMFVGVLGSTLMARVGPDRHQEALAMPYVRPMDFTGRPMTGYVFVDADGLTRDRDLEGWISWCSRFVATLPPRRE